MITNHPVTLFLYTVYRKQNLRSRDGTIYHPQKEKFIKTAVKVAIEI